MNEEYYELLEKFLERAKLIDELVLMSRGYFNQELQALRGEQKDDVKKLRGMETEIKSQWDNIGLS
jgi:hypothetical protein